MKHEDRIIRDAQICGGEPVLRGTRVTLRTVLASLAAGDSTKEILAAFPALKAEDVQAELPSPRRPQRKTCPFQLLRTSDEN